MSGQELINCIKEHNLEDYNFLVFQDGGIDSDELGFEISHQTKEVYLY